jgi:hypothetical protein
MKSAHTHTDRLEPIERASRDEITALQLERLRQQDRLCVDANDRAFARQHARDQPRVRSRPTSHLDHRHAGRDREPLEEVGQIFGVAGEELAARLFEVRAAGEGDAQVGRGRRVSRVKRVAAGLLA